MAKSKYKFKNTDEGYDVFLGSKRLGEIHPMQEASGRHSFYLGCDDSPDPRVYRGKIKAAEALHAIDKLSAVAKKKKWNHTKVIVHAWSGRPSAS